MRRGPSLICVATRVVTIVVAAVTTAAGSGSVRAQDNPYGVDEGDAEDGFCSNDVAPIDEGRLYDMVDAVTAQPLPPTQRWPAWDRRREPERFAAVRSFTHMRAEDLGVLRRHGLAVVTSHEANPAHAYGLLFVHDMPIMVTMESLFWAVAVGHQTMLEALEQTRLFPRTEALLADMHARVDPSTRAGADADLYLSIARSLISDTTVTPRLAANGARAEAIVRMLHGDGEGLGTLDVFGRVRLLDLSQYKPRGGYADDPARRRWFRAMTWLTRFELNVVSRDCRSSHPSYAPDPSETPREAELAWTLSQLAGDADLAAELAALSRTLDVMVAPRVDASADDLVRALSNGPFSHAALARAIGDRFARTTPTHPMPRVDDQPVVWTLLGLRATESTDTLATFLTPRVPHRVALTGGEVAVALGHPRGKAHLASELARFPALREPLAGAAALFSELMARDTLRGAWLDAIVALGERPGGVTPSFVGGEAYDDFRLNTALAAYARLRRNHIAYEAAPFSWGGCDVPDAFVEPAPAALTKLVAYAQRGQALARALDPDGAVGVARYYHRLERVFGTLSAIVARELAGVPLSREERMFLHQIVEKQENIYDSSVAWDGWFMDLFFAERPLAAAPRPVGGMPRIGGGNVRDPLTAVERASGIVSNVPEALTPPDVVVDVATAVDEDAGSAVSHLGTSGTDWAVFIVDTGGAPRALIGPVSLAYAAPRAELERLDDGAARRLAQTERLAPWTKTFAPRFTRAPKPWPHATFEVDCADPEACTALEIAIHSDAAIGPVTLALVGSSEELVMQRTLHLAAGATTVRFDAPARRRPVASKGKAAPTASDDEGVEHDEGDMRWRVREVILRRGLDEYRFGVGDDVEGGLPKTLTFGPREVDAAADADGDGEAGVDDGGASEYDIAP